MITTLFLIEIPLTLWSFGFEFYKPYGQVPHASLHLSAPVGVAVGAGEMEKDTIKELARVKRELEGSRSLLARTREENQELRARIAWSESLSQSG